MKDPSFVTTSEKTKPEDILANKRFVTDFRDHNATISAKSNHLVEL